MIRMSVNSQRRVLTHRPGAERTHLGQAAEVVVEGLRLSMLDGMIQSSRCQDQCLVPQRQKTSII